MAGKTYGAGLEHGKVIIDSYSGEAMNPRFAKVWRDSCEAVVLLEDVAKVLGNIGIEVDETYNDSEYFTVRALTTEEKAWSEAEYWKYRDPWNGDFRMVTES